MRRIEMADYNLKLFLVGKNSLKSRETAVTVRKALDLALKDNYHLEIIDVLDKPELAVNDDVLATPTLLSSAAPTTRRIVGDMKDPNEVRIGLELIIRRE